MNTYKRHRFPPDTISYAVWLYYRFNLSHRDIEDLLAKSRIAVTRESIRLWYPKHSLRSWGRPCIKFGAIYTRRLKRRLRDYGDTSYTDEVFVKISGKQHYRWRAVDQESLPHERSDCFGHGKVVDVYLQTKRDGAAAKRFFRRLLRKCRGEPRKIVTDKLRSYLVAHREVIPEAIHVTDRYENNRAEQSQSLPRFMGTKTPGCESEVCGGSSRLIRLSAS